MKNKYLTEIFLLWEKNILRACHPLQYKRIYVDVCQGRPDKPVGDW